MDFAIPAECKTERKWNWDLYLDLTRELNKLWNIIQTEIGGVGFLNWLEYSEDSWRPADTCCHLAPNENIQLIIIIIIIIIRRRRRRRKIHIYIIPLIYNIWRCPWCNGYRRIKWTRRCGCWQRESREIRVFSEQW